MRTSKDSARTDESAARTARRRPRRARPPRPDCHRRPQGSHCTKGQYPGHLPRAMRWPLPMADDGTDAGSVSNAIDSADRRADAGAGCVKTTMRSTAPVTLEPDAILPAQLMGGRRFDAASMPEKRLLLAVLEDAVITFQRYTTSTQRRGQRLFREAEAGSYRTTCARPAASRTSATCSDSTASTCARDCWPGASGGAARTRYRSRTDIPSVGSAGPARAPSGARSASRVSPCAPGGVPSAAEPRSTSERPGASRHSDASFSHGHGRPSADGTPGHPAALALCDGLSGAGAIFLAAARRSTERRITS